MAEQISTSGINYVNGNYYQTEVRLANDGTATGSYTTYRVNPDGSNPVPIYGQATVDGQLAASINSDNATPEEIAALGDYDSELAQTQRSQVRETEGDFFGDEADPVEEGVDEDGAIGGQAGAGGATQSPGSAAASGGSPAIYPLDMDKNLQDYILFTCPEGSYSVKEVLIGIQPQISDSNAVEWGGSTLNQIQKEVANLLFKNAFTGSLEDLAKEAGDLLINKAKGSAGAAGGAANNLAKSWLIEQAMGLQGLGARDEFGNGTGGIINPNLELVFTGPTLRPFTFTFRMTAREKKESENIKKIIRFFKQNMAPRKEGTFVLKRPAYFNIEYKGLAADNGYLNKIKKKCALTNCSVDYTPDGSYMTYQEDGAMTAYNVTLQFQETRALYDEDYKELPDNIIGY